MNSMQNFSGVHIAECGDEIIVTDRVRSVVASKCQCGICWNYADVMSD